MALKFLWFFIATSNAIYRPYYPEPVNSFLICMFKEFCVTKGIDPIQDAFYLAKSTCSNLATEEILSQFNLIKIENDFLTLDLISNKQRYFFSGHACTDLKWNEATHFSIPSLNSETKNTLAAEGFDDDSSLGDLSEMLSCEAHQLNTEAGCVDACTVGQIVIQDPQNRRADYLSNWTNAILSPSHLTSSKYTDTKPIGFQCKSCNEIYSEKEVPLELIKGECVAKYLEPCPSKSIRDLDGKCYFNNSVDYCTNQTENYKKIVSSFAADSFSFPTHNSCDQHQYSRAVKEVVFLNEKKLENFFVSCTQALDLRKDKVIEQNSGPQFREPTHYLENSSLKTLAKCLQKAPAKSLSGNFISIISTLQ